MVISQQKGFAYARSMWSKVFVATWLVLFSVSVTNPFSLFDINLFTYFLLAVFVVSFFVGINFPVRYSGFSQRAIAPILLDKFDRIAKNKYVIAWFAIVVVLLLVYFIRFYGYIASSGADNARVSRFEVGGVFSSSFEAIVFDYGIASSVWLMRFVCAFGIVFSRVKSLLWLASLAGCALFMGFGAGRNIIIEIGLMILFLRTVRAYVGPTTERTKNSLLIFLVFFALYLVSLYATAFRLSGDSFVGLEDLIDANEKMLEHLVVYSVGSFRALDYAVFYMDGVFGHKNGLLTFSGFDEIISLFLRLIGYDILPYSNEFGVILAENIMVGEGVNFNALYTAVFNFYYDFGVFGVLIFGMAFGFMCSSVLRLAFVKGRIAGLFISVVFFVVSMTACFTWKLQSGSLVFVLCCVYLYGVFESRKAIGN